MEDVQKDVSRLTNGFFTRPGDFGYGNVTTGQVASRKYEILTRASSVGLSEREGLNPDLSNSARASPAPLFPVAVHPQQMQMQMKSMATGEAEMSVQVCTLLLN